MRSRLSSFERFSASQCKRLHTTRDHATKSKKARSDVPISDGTDMGGFARDRLVSRGSAALGEVLLLDLDDGSVLEGQPVRKFA